MRASVRTQLVRLHLALAAVWVLVSSASAAAWTSTSGELGRETSRLTLQIGANWTTMNGSDVENLDPAPGVDAEGRIRVLGSLSVVGGYALSRANVKGQLRHLFDQPVRPDARSANVVGEVECRRLRIGLRLDAYRERGWRFCPYFAAAVVLTRVDVTLDTVDGAPPERVPSGPGRDPVDVRSFDRSTTGGMGRAGLEILLLPNLALDVNATLEVLDLPAGTYDAFSAGGGLVARL